MSNRDEVIKDADDNAIGTTVSTEDSTGVSEPNRNGGQTWQR